MTALLGRASIGFVPTGCCAAACVLAFSEHTFITAPLFLSAKRKILPHRR